MKKQKTNTEETLGAETVPERKPSKLYAMKAFKAAAGKLKTLQMINPEDSKTLDRINNNLLNAYLMGETEEEKVPRETN